MEWSHPSARRFWERLAQRHRLVRYDGRGIGLSQAPGIEFSADSRLRDLEAVVDAAGLDRFALLGLSEGGSTAIRYAAAHPDRVSHLILYGTFARYDLSPDEQQQWRALGILMRTGWGQDNPVFRQTFANMRLGPEADAEQLAWFNEMQRQSASAETATAFLRALAGIDVRDEASRIRAPTLVMHRRGDIVVPFARGRELAAQIPDARFLPLEGDNHTLLASDPVAEQFAAAIEQFVAPADAPATPRDAREEAAFRTILFTDVEASTELTDRFGDAMARDILRDHERLTREALAQHAGTEIKTMGDGFMASFLSASSALDAAIAMQRSITAQFGDSQTPIRIRIGINAGEPISEDNDLYGTAVIRAARIMGQAGGGEVLTSDIVRGLVAGKDYLFEDRGQASLKGFDEPVRLFGVRWQESP